MSPAEAAVRLAEIAALLELRGDDPFRVRAFRNAAAALETALPEQLLDAAALRQLPGVGDTIGSVVEEMRRGGSALYARLARETPPALTELLRVPGLGAKRALALHRDIGVGSLDTLDDAVRDGTAARVSGIGPKTLAKLPAGIAFARSTLGRRRRPRARAVAEAYAASLRALPEVHAATIAGDVRRGLETTEAAEIVVATEQPEVVWREMRARGGTAPHADAGPFAAAEIALVGGFMLRVRCSAARHFGAALVQATGSAAHLSELRAHAASAGLELAEGALRRGTERLHTPDEEALYARLGLPWIAPELREGADEVVAALADELPALVEEHDLRGTFHCHSDYSDGTATIAEMAEGARARGWSYLGIADHSRGAAYAGGLTAARVVAQRSEIDRWNDRDGGTGAGRFRILHGTECEILRDGSLDFDAGTLRRFDYVVGSVHSAFDLPEREQTARLLRALANPYLTMLGHPTGRLLLMRPGYAVDVRAVIDAAAQFGVLIEINADPHRLDLDWRWLRYAQERGILVPINPDAHSVAGLDNIDYGVAVARKGWLRAADVFNTRPLEAVEEFLAERKQRRAA